MEDSKLRDIGKIENKMSVHDLHPLVYSMYLDRKNKSDICDVIKDKLTEIYSDINDALTGEIIETIKKFDSSFYHKLIGVDSSNGEFFVHTINEILEDGTIKCTPLNLEGDLIQGPIKKIPIVSAEFTDNIQFKRLTIDHTFDSEYMDQDGDSIVSDLSKYGDDYEK